MIRIGNLKIFLITVFLMGISLFSLTGCSVMRAFIEGLRHGELNDAGHALTDAQIEKYLLNIRPHKDPDPHYRMGCYLQQRNKHKLAVQEFNKAIQLDPDHVEAYNGIGISYDALGDYAKAIASYQTALRLNSRLDYVLNNIGYSYLIQGDPAAAIDALKKAIELSPDIKRYHNNLGLAYAKLRQYDQAFEEFRHTGDEASAHTMIGQLLFDKGSYDQARQHFSLALASNASSGETKNRLKAADALAQITKQKEVDGPGIKRSYVTAHLKKENKNALKTTKQGIAKEKLESPSDITIEIININGTDYSAKRIENNLINKGFKVKRFRAVKQSNYEKTKIYYCSGFLNDADVVAKEIPGYPRKESVAKIKVPNADLRIVIGRDLLTYNWFHRFLKNHLLPFFNKLFAQTSSINETA